MISRRDMLRTSGTALAGFAALPNPLRYLNGSQSDDDLTQYVDPFIGTGSHGHTYPGVQLPFGMVQLSPDNGVNGWDWSSGYHWSSERIAGFSHTHLSGTGIGDMYDILLMPTFTSTPPLPASVASRFSHEREHAAPGYYSVDLTTTDIGVELTATERVGIHRYAFPAPPAGHRTSIVVDLGHSLNWDQPTETRLNVESPTLISGYRYSTGWARDQRVFFVASFSSPFNAHWLESEWASPDSRTELTGQRVKGCFQFPGSQRRIIAKVGISCVSIDGAKRNLRKEASGWDFDAIRRAASEAWNEALGRIHLGPTTRQQQTLLYTSLYHSLLTPQLFCDVDGAYRGPDGDIHHTQAFKNYTVFSLWDTFRAEHPLLTLVQPERVDDLVQSMMAFYRESGLLPVWSLAGNETDTMIGYHSVPVIAEAWAKQLTRIEPRAALDAMIKSATQDEHGLRYYGMPAAKSLRQLEEEQTPQDLRRISEIRQDELSRLGNLVNGYARSLEGDAIRYHSPLSGDHSALLTRTDDDRKSIAWETAPVPVDVAGKPLSFVWLVGMDAGEDRHRFELSINGRPTFQFRGPRPPDEDFRATTPRGAELEFRATHTDQYDDLFGFMFLTLPTGLAAGERLTLRVTGEAAGTSDWYMTFEQPMAASLTAENVYAFLRDGRQNRQVVRANVQHLKAPMEAELRCGDDEPRKVRLQFGPNQFLLPAPIVREETHIAVRLMIAGQPAGQTEMQLRPVQPFGYIPADWERESVSKTLEYAYDDWCIHKFAESIGEDYDALTFSERAEFYRNVFDPDTGFMRARLSDGSWKKPFSPVAASHRQDEYTEGNAWQYSWFVPHDVQGLTDLMGGRDAFIAKLDELFEQSSELEGAAPPDISGMIGQYAQGNEPSHHVAYLYCYAGAPWKTQERVRQITDGLYDATPQGLPGNEDCGQMSAWYVLSAIGFYPVNPAEGIYVIGTPHHERSVLRLENGREFTIEAPGTSPENKYIRSATLNGRPLDRCYITHAEIVAGGTLSFQMADTPNRAWASGPHSAPPSTTRR
jgi:putative alpha-1,2-mannosidase